MTPVSVLVVEDDPQVRATAVRMLERSGYEVVDAYNGAQALARPKARPDVSVLLADVRMPGLSGIDLAERARDARPDLRVVLTSGYISKDDVPEGTVFVPKPWRAADLAAAVERACHA